MRPYRATRAGTQAPPLPISIIFFHTSHTNKITIYAQSTQTRSTIPRAIHPNETVGAVPVCPPERPRSGVSISKTHALCMGMNGGCASAGRCGRAHRRRPYPISIIFFHAIPYKQNNHSRAICPNDINRPRVIHPNETVGAAPVCPPERPRGGVSIPKIHALCAGN